MIRPAGVVLTTRSVLAVLARLNPRRRAGFSRRVSRRTALDLTLHPCAEGATLYSNRDYVSPNVIRAREKVAKSVKYASRKENQKASVMRKQLAPQIKDPFKQVFK